MAQLTSCLTGHARQSVEWLKEVTNRNEMHRCKFQSITAQIVQRSRAAAYGTTLPHRQSSENTSARSESV